ncbi:MAG: hypothetical protein ABEJ07_04975 [Candidatus Nanohaloarchaea archaeon]
MELPEWLDATAYSNHRDSVEYCYENGWITGLVTTIEPFFQTWTENELENEGAEFVDTGRGYEAIEIDGERINFNDYYQELNQRTSINSDYLTESSNNTIDVLEDLQQLRNAACHRPGYFESEPLDEDGQFNDYTGEGGIETSPEEVINLYEEILGLPEENSITNSNSGSAETAFFPDGNPNEFYSQSLIDEPLHADLFEPNPTGVNHLNSIASGMYHGIGHPNLSEMNRGGYTTRYNPAQPASAILMYNWFETRLPEIIEDEYESQNLNTGILPDELPQPINGVSLNDWIDEEIISQIDILPSTAYPNALEDPRQRLEELGEIRNNLAHDVNFYGEIEDLDIRDNIWHGYEIMHIMSDRTGYRTNEFELFGEEAEQQRRARPYMTRSERLTSWPTN